MTQTQDSVERPLLFISHKHTDKRIADILSNFISTYSGGRVAVFQSYVSVGEFAKSWEKPQQRATESFVEDSGFDLDLYRARSMTGITACGSTWASITRAMAWRKGAGSASCA